MALNNWIHAAGQGLRLPNYISLNICVIIYQDNMQ